MDLFKLLGTVSIDNAQAIKALDDTTQKGQQTGSKLSGAFSTMGKGALAVGKTIAVGMVAGATAMGALTIKAMNLAGELEQNMGGSEQVFKDYAGKMQETAKSAFSNMGLSTSEFLGTANKMGALFQGAGFSIEESSDLASNAMQRAADVASIMGIDTASAMEAVAGAAKGNFTMMDNLGVAMNDTTLQAYALEKGISKSTTEMTNQEKIGLAMELFMEKTAYAAGNYAKENETLAGSLGTAKAALTNFLDGSGDVDSLVSAFSNAANVIIKNVTEIAPRLVTGLTEIVNQIMPKIPGLLQQLLPVIITAVVGLLSNIATILPDLVTLLIEEVIPTLLDALVSVMDTVVTILPKLIEAIVGALPALVPQLVDAIMRVFTMVGSQYATIFQPIIDILPELLLSIVDTVMQNLPILIEGLITMYLAILQALPTLIEMIVDTLPDLIAMLIEGLLGCLPQLIVGLIKLVAGIAVAAVRIWAAWYEISIKLWMGILKGIYNVFSNLGEWFKDKFGDAIKKAVGAWSDVKARFAEKWNQVKQVFSNVGGWFGDKFAQAWQRVKNVFSGVKSFFTGIWNDIKTAFSDIGTKIADSISSAVKKGINGLIGSAENIINGFFGMINGAIDMINKIPKVNISKIKMVEFARLAEGGVVDKPTPALFGEDGAEAVVPLENNTGWLNKIALRLYEFNAQRKDGLDSLSIRSVELQQVQVTEMQTMNITLNKILGAIMLMDENMGGHLRDALEGVSFDVNKREFARLVRGAI